MNILLVNPPAGFSYYSIGLRRPPLGLAYLASVLRKHHNVRIVDFNVEMPHWKKYPFGEFDVVGISVDTTRYSISLRIAELARSRGAVVVVGGPHVSFLDSDPLLSGAVSYVVRNEGEYAFLSLIRFLSDEIPFEDVRGVSYLSGGQTCRTPDAPFIENLDTLPLPARDLLPLKRYREKMNGRLMTTLISSRGCPFKCEFCSASQFFGARWRARSAESVFEEIELLHKEYGYRALTFVDDNFTLDPDRVCRLSERVIERGWDLIWGAMSRVETVVNNARTVRLMARAGLRWVFLGIESGSQEVLNEYGKKTCTRDAYRAMDILRENGVEVTAGFILGAPDETPEMMKETIRFAKRLNPKRAQFSILTAFPGTRLYERVKDRLLTTKWEDFTCLWPTFRLDRTSSAELAKLLIGAYCSFYGRPLKLFEHTPYLYRMFPGLSKVIATKLLSEAAKLGSLVPVVTRKSLARIHS